IGLDDTPWSAMDIVPKRAPDSWLFCTVVALVATGVVMVYSASAIVAQDRYGDGAFFFKRQVAWAGLGMMALLIMQRTQYAGVRLVHLLGLSMASIPLLTVAALGEEYRRQRLLAFLDPWRDPQGAGFHIIQSLLALGSGGELGLGLGESRQKFFYLPERHTDF